MLKHSLIALAALGAGLAGLPASQASAFPTAPAVQPPSDSLRVDVRDNNRHGNWNNNNRNRNGNWDRHRHGDRCGNWSNRCRYRHGGYYYENPWWLLPMVGAGIAIGAGSGYGDGYGSRHVEWCMDRYRSYNVRTNTWVSYGGRVRECISPYSR